MGTWYFCLLLLHYFIKKDVERSVIIFISKTTLSNMKFLNCQAYMMPSFFPPHSTFKILVKLCLCWQMLLVLMQLISTFPFLKSLKQVLVLRITRVGSKANKNNLWTWEGLWYIKRCQRFEVNTVERMNWRWHALIKINYHASLFRTTWWGYGGVESKKVLPKSVRLRVK